MGSDDDDLPPLITPVETATGPVSDGEATPKIHATKGLLPEKHIAGTGFLDAELLVTSKRDYNVDLVGPIRTNWRWEARDGQGFGIHDFSIDWDNQKAVCPEDHTNQEWSTKTDI